MSEDMKMIIAAGVGFVVFVFCYFKIFWHGRSREQKFIEKAKEQGNFVEGNFVDYKISLGNESSKSARLRYDSYIVKYEYIVEGKKYYKKLVFRTKGNMRANYPYTITVYYDPKKPHKGVAGNQATNQVQKTRGCLVTVIITLVVIRVMIRILGIF